jgi:cytochrome c-type biogenesis protein CcmF
MGKAAQLFNAYTPVMGFSLVVFNFVVIVQEFTLLFRSRTKTGANKTPRALWGTAGAAILAGATIMKMTSGPVHLAGTITLALGAIVGVCTFGWTMITLPPTGRRRYGGYIVHLGIAFMFLGFTGKSWGIDRETTLSPGQTYTIDRLTVQYVGPRMEVDNTKRMIFADVRVLENGVEVDKLDPAKFIYKKMPEQPTTEVSMMHTIRDDLYLVVGTINPETKTATLQLHLNLLVGWIWFGALILIFGSVICMWPELEPEESRVWQVVRGASAIATSITIGVILALLPVPAFAQQTATQHAGSVQMDDLKEKQVFGQLRCMCGTCARELLSSCACSTADATRERLRMRLQRGDTPEMIVKDYTAEFGIEALAIPPNQGAMRAIYAVPIVALVGTGVGLAVALRRWRSNANSAEGDASSGTKKKRGAKAEATTERDDYDDRIDAELRDLDD